MESSVQKRDISIDLVKLIAIIGVVIIHSCDFTAAIASSDWNFSLFWRTFAGSSVPLFLMASGAVMLESKKEIPLKKLYLKNILRIVVAMVFWGVVYKIYHLNYSDDLTLATAVNGIKEVLVFNQEFHFYYMHMILIVYAFLPLTKLIIDHASEKQLRYVLILWIALAVVYPTIKHLHPFTLLSGMTTMWGINLTYASIGYGILGYYIKKHPVSLPKSLALICCGFGSMFVLTYCNSTKFGILYEHYLAGNGICAFLLASGFFALAGSVKISSVKAQNAVSWFSKSSFCIYLVHMLVMYVLKDNGINVGFASNIISIPLYAMLIIAICAVFYFALSRIPFVRKWLI